MQTLSMFECMCARRGGGCCTTVTLAVASGWLYIYIDIASIFNIFIDILGSYLKMD